MNRTVFAVWLLALVLLGLVACATPPPQESERAGFTSVPSSSGGGIPGVTVSGTPASGEVLTATSTSAATWQAAAGGAPSGAAGGDLASTYPNPTVAKVNGTSYSAGGSLAVGSIPRVTGASSVAYGALNLADTDAVTGLLPFANLATVTSVNSVAMPAGGALSTGAVFRATGVSTAAYGQVDLADTDAVTGVLPSANLASATTGAVGAVQLTGNLGGTATSPTVVGLTIPSEAQGDLFYRGSSAWVRLGAGTTGQALITGGAAANPAWGSNFGANNLLTTGFLSIGATVASTGDVRLGQTSSIRAIDAAGTGNINVASTAAGVITYGGTANSGIVIGTSTGNKVSSQVNGVEIAKVDGSGITVPAMSTAGLVHNSSAGLFSSSTLVNADVSASAAIAGTKVSPDFGSQSVVTTGAYSSGSTPSGAATGINCGNNVSCMTFRNGANSADLTIVTSNSSNTVTLGSATSGTTQLQAATTLNLISANTVALTANAITLGNNAADKTINQGDKTTNSATGQKLTIRGQNETGTTSTGGDFEIGPGTGTSTNGNLRLINMTVTGTAPSAGAGGALPITPEGYVTIYINGTARKIAYYP